MGTIDTKKGNGPGKSGSRETYQNILEIKPPWFLTLYENKQTIKQKEKSSVKLEKLPEPSRLLMVLKN